MKALWLLLLFAQASPEKDWFLKRKGELERYVHGAEPNDVIVTREARRITGRIESQEREEVAILTTIGKLTVRREEIKEIRKGVELKTDFKYRLGNAAADVRAYRPILAWAESWEIPPYREYVAYLTLLVDPNDERARKVAGYAREPDGRWKLDPLEMALLDPSNEPVPETRAELRLILSKMGFVRKPDGRWHGKAPWAAAIDNLHQPGAFQYSTADCKVVTMHEGDTPLARFTNTAAQAGAYKGEPRLKLLAPAGKSGSVAIPVEAPGEILSCQVRAVSIVVAHHEDRAKKMGKVEVAVAPEGGRGATLYSKDDFGDTDWHDVTEHVRGKRKFTVTAKMTTVIDKWHAWAQFLPGGPDARESFGVRGFVLQPAAEIDRLWNALK